MFYHIILVSEMTYYYVSSGTLNPA